MLKIKEDNLTWTLLDDIPCSIHCDRGKGISKEQSVKLNDLGFTIYENEIFGAPDAAIKFIKNSGKKRIFLLTTGDVYKDFLNEDLISDEKNKDVNFVVVGDVI